MDSRYDAKTQMLPTAKDAKKTQYLPAWAAEQHSTSTRQQTSMMLKKQDKAQARTGDANAASGKRTMLWACIAVLAGLTGLNLFIAIQAHTKSNLVIEDKLHTPEARQASAEESRLEDEVQALRRQLQIQQRETNNLIQKIREQGYALGTIKNDVDALKTRP